jgi:hypothetical protein
MCNIVTIAFLSREMQSEHVINVRPENGEDGGSAFMADFFDDVRGPESVPVISFHVMVLGKR